MLKISENWRVADKERTRWLSEKFNQKFLNSAGKKNLDTPHCS